MELLMKFKTPIIFIFLVLVCFIIYSQFFAPSGNQAPSGLIQTSATGANGGAPDPNSDLISQLVALQNVSFKTDLLIDPAFVSLQDFSRSLVLQPIGRPNPFAPISGVASLSTPPAPNATSTASSTKSSSKAS